jgi:hypothetical protein
VVGLDGNWGADKYQGEKKVTVLLLPGMSASEDYDQEAL